MHIHLPDKSVASATGGQQAVSLTPPLPNMWTEMPGREHVRCHHRLSTLPARPCRKKAPSRMEAPAHA